MGSPSPFHTLAARYAPYVDEVKGFLSTCGVPFGSQQDVPAFAAAVSEPGYLRDGMSSIIRAIIYREKEEVSHLELLDVLLVAVGGLDVEEDAPGIDRSKRELSRFIGQAMTSLWGKRENNARPAITEDLGRPEEPAHARTHENGSSDLVRKCYFAEILTAQATHDATSWLSTASGETEPLMVLNGRRAPEPAPAELLSDTEISPPPDHIAASVVDPVTSEPMPERAPEQEERRALDPVFEEPVHPAPEPLAIEIVHPVAAEPVLDPVAISMVEPFLPDAAPEPIANTLPEATVAEVITAPHGAEVPVYLATASEAAVPDANFAESAASADTEVLLTDAATPAPDLAPHAEPVTVSAPEPIELVPPKREVVADRAGQPPRVWAPIAPLFRQQPDRAALPHPVAARRFLVPAALCLAGLGALSIAPLVDLLSGGHHTQVSQPVTRAPRSATPSALVIPVLPPLAPIADIDAVGTSSSDSSEQDLDRLTEPRVRVHAARKRSASPIAPQPRPVHPAPNRDAAPDANPRAMDLPSADRGSPASATDLAAAALTPRL